MPGDTSQLACGKEALLYRCLPAFPELKHLTQTASNPERELF